MLSVGPGDGRATPQPTGPSRDRQPASSRPPAVTRRDLGRQLRERWTAALAARRAVAGPYALAVGGAAAALAAVALALAAPGLRGVPELATILVEVTGPTTGSPHVAVPVVPQPGLTEPVTLPAVTVPWLLVGSALVVAGPLLTAASAVRRLWSHLVVVAAAVVLVVCAALGAALLPGDQPVVRQVAWFGLLHRVAATAVVPAAALTWGALGYGLALLAGRLTRSWGWRLPRWSGLAMVALLVLPAWAEAALAGVVPAGTSASALLGVVLLAALAVFGWPARAARRDVGWALPAGVAAAAVALAAGWALARTALGAGVPSLEPFLTVGSWAGVGAWCAVALGLLLGLLPGQRPEPDTGVRQGAQPDQQAQAEKQQQQRDEPRREGGAGWVEESVQWSGDRARRDVDRQVQQRDDQPYQRPEPPQPTARTDPEPFGRREQRDHQMFQRRRR